MTNKMKTALFLIVDFICSSCICLSSEYETCTKTQWSSEERPLGPINVNELILSFDDDVNVTISLADLVELHGKHYDDGPTSTFSNLQVEIDGLTITFIEAHLKNDETLFLLWQVEDILYPFTTALHPL